MKTNKGSNAAGLSREWDYECHLSWKCIVGKVQGGDLSVPQRNDGIAFPAIQILHSLFRGYRRAVIEPYYLIRTLLYMTLIHRQRLGKSTALAAEIGGKYAAGKREIAVSCSLPNHPTSLQLYFDFWFQGKFKAPKLRIRESLFCPRGAGMDTCAALTGIKYITKTHKFSINHVQNF